MFVTMVNSAILYKSFYSQWIKSLFHKMWLKNKTTNNIMIFISYLFFQHSSIPMHLPVSETQ